MFKCTKDLIANWKNCEENISLLFKQRKLDKAKDDLLQQLNNFKLAMYYCNEMKPPINFTNMMQDIAKMEYKPVNIVERLNFIEARPNHYHSFIQLKACFQEFEKINARAIVIKRRKDQSKED